MSRLMRTGSQVGPRPHPSLSTSIRQGVPELKPSGGISDVGAGEIHPETGATRPQRTPDHRHRRRSRRIILRRLIAPRCHNGTARRDLNSREDQGETLHPGTEVGLR